MSKSNLLLSQIKVVSTGSVAIGTSSSPISGSKLHVVGGYTAFTQTTSTPTSAAFIRGLNAYSTAINPDYSWYNNDQTGLFHPGSGILGFTINGSETMRLSSVGNVGIGNSNPNYKLDVLGWGVRYASSSQLFFYLNNSDPRICSSTNSIVFYKWDNSGFIDIHCQTVHEYSDSTSKKNIKPLKSSLDKLKKINGYSYNWKSDSKNEKPQCGLIAQQVEGIIPEVVITDDSTGNKMISYTHLVPYLIEAIKEQNSTIENMAEQIITLKNQVSEIQNCCNSDGLLKSYNEPQSTQNNLTNQTNAVLYQNAPNPFKQSTIIKIEIPQNVGSAMVCIYDLTGKQLKCLTVTGRGATSVQLFANELTAGMYHYALITDGVLIGTKTMILTE